MTSTRNEHAFVSRRAAVAAGITNHAFYTQVTVDRLHRIRPGWYSPRDLEFPDQRHLEQIVTAIAALKQAADTAVLSHVSAAAWHGLPIWGLDTTRVHFTRSGSPGLGRTRSVRPHRAQLTDSEITTVDGVRVTTMARTVLDIARWHPFTQGVVVADAALNRGMDVEELRSVWEIARSRGSARTAQRVIAFADGRAESVLESRSRVCMAAIGLPVPDLQVRIHNACGREVARVDFDFPGFRTVGESDGDVKYGRLLRPGETAADVIARQYAREQRIIATGRQVARWGSPDLEAPQRLLRQFTQAVTRAGFACWEPGPSRLPFLRWSSLAGWLQSD